MSALAIRCQGIGKRYRIGQRQRYNALRDTLSDALRAPGRQLAAALGAPSRQRGPEYLWALRDISLQVRHGEVLGIIGRNGAGKSTLLKLLSRISKPTEGRVEIQGRMGALLEVGTGFHPELTGRENIYLNGAILGMTRREINCKFDEIVNFAECGQFLDMPVKRYSSGMHVRLAFAVAAHLEAEILIVDEVLAVGDAAFQKKCLGKMGEAAHHGRTVLFVSHNLVAVDSLCTRAICLHEGRIVMEGLPIQVTSRYLQNCIPASNELMYHDINSAPGNDVFRLRRACVRPLKGSPSDPITVRTSFVVEFEYWKRAPNVSLELCVDFHNEHGVYLFNTGIYGQPRMPAGLLRSSFIVPGDFLNNGTHRIDLAVDVGAVSEVLCLDSLLVFEVHDVGSDLRAGYHGAWPGAIRPALQWTTEQLDSPSVGH
ncbi:MAG: ATP-binding cassette domain-containing protein [Acidobacteriaceae bacterium]|nr:ATP-binding cassette domain-containing protein [Acidobacteriaceae bacterium]MBV9573984.1 ATP-binding cassette domain-containing protein [Terriglobales bacterium]